MNYYTNYLSTFRLSFSSVHNMDVEHGCGPGQYTMFYIKYTHILKRGWQRGHLW